MARETRQGIFVTGTFISTHDAPLWRASLGETITAAIVQALPDSSNDLPVYCSFPLDSYLPDPHPPVFIAIAMNQSEVYFHGGAEETRFLRAVASAVMEWMVASHCKDDTDPIRDLVITLRRGASDGFIRLSAP